MWPPGSPLGTFWPKWVPFRSPFLVKGYPFFQKVLRNKLFESQIRVAKRSRAIPPPPSGSKRANERVRSPFCLKKVPLRSQFFGKMGPLWVPFSRKSGPHQFWSHCYWIMNYVSLPSLFSSSIWVCALQEANQTKIGFIKPDGLCRGEYSVKKQGTLPGHHFQKWSTFPKITLNGTMPSLMNT